MYNLYSYLRIYLVRANRINKWWIIERE